MRYTREGSHPWPCEAELDGRNKCTCAVPVSRVRLRCIRKGHKWRQKVLYMVGDDVCARRGCDATRINPHMIPPEGWPFHA